MKALAPNTLLQNRYLIVHLIGKGGMGDVYLAVDQRLGSAVALKRTFFSDDEMLGNAFEREAKTLARLRHPVLPKVSDHFTENDEQFLVMEHISGDDLSKRLEAMQKPFPLSWVLFWADHLLDALAYLHAHEPPIIHRDIKPQNLKLTDENHIILLDFGLSKNNTGESRVVSSGSTGSVVGYTPHYAPMEQIRGTGTNPKSDLYSLSATLYQLMTNVVPADALTRADALLNDMPDPIKPISELNNEIPKSVSDVILKGIEISQDRRFANAREMQKALRDAYSQMQNAMTAQTVAFNVQNEELPAPVPPTPPIVTGSNEKTEVLNIPPAEILPVAVQETPLTSHPQAQKFASVPNPPNEPEPNFDATLKMDAPVNDYAPKQADVKTEIFIAGSTPIINEVQQGNIHQTGGKTAEENFAPTENYSTAEDLGQKTSGADNGGGYTPEATVPLFTYDEQQTPSASPSDAEFYTTPNVEVPQDAFATYTPATNGAQEDFSLTENYSQEDFSQPQEQQHQSFAPVPPPQSDSQPPQVQTPPPPVKKKSGAKILGVVFGLGFLLVLTAAALGGGWYYYKNYYSQGGGVEPTPVPSPSVEVSPTPIFTPTPDTNTNGADNTNLSTNSNSNVGNENSNTETNLNTNTGGTTRPTPTPNVQTSPTPIKTNPTPIKTNPTPIKTNPTPVKPPPTPKNQGGTNRTQILQ
ncbi:MAG TPA: serine/threonine-protein kinase [Pyrinomonadaceae bacterium]|nr:serine/threonine-protein kinase [Pyrinomonadaceae bacterium]